MQTYPDRVYRRLFHGLRSKWWAGWSCASEIRFAVAIALIWAAFYNFQFWHQTMRAMWQPSLAGIGFLISLSVLVVSVQSMLLLLMPTRWAMRALASALFVVAAASSYFSGAYGAIMNRDMLRNVLETDTAEVAGLINFHLVAWILVLGVLPAMLVWRVSLPEITKTRRLTQRLRFFITAVVLSAVGLFACSAEYAVFFREHKPIRYALMPTAPAWSLAGLLSSARAQAANQPLLKPAGAAWRTTAGQTRPLVVFIVIGETARAANFELGGYPRSTNPKLLAVENLAYFSRVESCGTSTAISVPCIFSPLGRERFDVDEAGRYANLLDSLVDAGFDVEWRDNNAGCKGVCARVRQINYADRPDPKLCPQSYCYDEVMLTDLESRLREVTRDTAIVFHQIGSHGPSYSERYPPEFERFKPACHSNELQHCTRQEIVNAYDNTIAYTDHVLARQIALLREASDHLDAVLIYASDHGESLGEQGIYLHGMPYGFASRLQKEVPMLLWTSRGYAARAGLRAGCVRGRATEAFSHDNLYHTILGAAQVRNRVYDPRLDILAACRVDLRAIGYE